MSKKVNRCREAVFVLMSELFSIHTFELFAKLTAREFERIKSNLFEIRDRQNRKGAFYKDKSWTGEGERYRCTIFKHYGIRIALEKNCTKGVETHYIRIIVNPRRLTEPDCAPVGIFVPEKSNMKKVVAAFHAVFEDTAIPNDLNWYQPSRIDRCMNIYCDTKKMFRELVRVLRKLPTPPKYERKYRTRGNRKERNKYNKHYIRFACKTREIILYDKTFQVIESGQEVDYEELPNGVLRLEIQENRERIRKVEKEHPEFSTEDILWHFVKTSEEQMIRAFSKCFSDVRFVRMEGLIEVIASSRYSEETKATMMELVRLLQRKQSVDKAIQVMEKQGMDTTGLLDKFDQLGVSPIPLRVNFCAESIPGPVTLLKNLAKGEVRVKYVKAKYK